MSDRRIDGHVDTSVKHGSYQFSARTDYEKYFLMKGVVSSASELWQSDDLIAQVQRHWHSRGQNGCVFAQAIASNAPIRGWEQTVLNMSVDEIAKPEMVTQIDKTIQDSITDSTTQVRSLLFPQVTQPKDLVKLVRVLDTVPSIFTAKEDHYEELSTVALRIDLKDKGVLSWLMGFGPYDFFPNTRQAPITEVAIRVKEKPETIFHRLNQDRETAHLADTPIYMEDRGCRKIMVSYLC